MTPIARCLLSNSSMEGGEYLQIDLSEKSDII
jgi:hypothetical protein